MRRLACLVLAAFTPAFAQTPVEVIDTFDEQPPLAPVQTAGAWYPDRRAPAGFVAPVALGGNNRLRLDIAAADVDPVNAFYNTQGRKYDLARNVRDIRVDLYVPSDWATTGRRMAGFWGTAVDTANVAKNYGILEFTSDGGTPRFRAWTSAGPSANTWTNLGLPSGFTYDTWYTLRIRLVPDGGGGFDLLYTLGDLSLSLEGGTAVRFSEFMLQGHNFPPAGVTSSVHWDNVAFTPPNLLHLETQPGSLFIQPFETATVDLRVANLSQPIVGLQAFLGFSSTYFLSGLDDVTVVAGGGPWSALIYFAWNAGGDLDLAVGLNFAAPPTSSNARTARVTLASNGTEGVTRVEFRPDLLVDPPLIATTLLTTSAGLEILPNTLDSQDIVIDGTPPSIAITAATQAPADVLASNVGSLAAIAGTVTITVTASDVSAGLDAPPTVTITPASGPAFPATYAGPGAPGEFVYTWTLTPSTPNGIATISATVTDRAGNSANDTDTVVVNVRTITGTIEYQTLRTGGPSVAYVVNRTVTLTATDASGAVLATWPAPVSFTNNNTTGFASGTFSLNRIPPTTARLSAKTAWTLRRRIAADIIATPALTVAFTGTSRLNGGDINGNNVVTNADLAVLRSTFLTAIPTADINGDGAVTNADLALLRQTFLTSGDAP
jgi:hypothetical protein